MEKKRSDPAPSYGARERATTLQQHYEELSQEQGLSNLRIWSMDEHRIGLKPIHRRDWFPWWVVPSALFQWCFDWLWVYGFVEPSTGETDWWLLPRVNHQRFSQVLADESPSQWD